MSINLSLTPEQKQVQELARKLASDFATRAASHDRERSAPTENYAALRDAGFYGLCVPKEYGGLGLGLRGWLIAAEELAQGCAATALSFNMHMNAMGILMEDPSIPQQVKRRAADLAIREGRLMCASLSEATSSSHAVQSFVPGVTARRVAGGYRLYGKKAFVTMWESSDLAFMYARAEGEASPVAALGLLVPTRGEGVTVHDDWHTLGMRATRSQSVSLEGAFVPEENVLYRPESLFDSFLIRHGGWSFGGFVAAYLGLGTAIFNLAAQLLRTRTAKGFAQPMGYHPDIRRRVTEMACELEAARLVLWKAAQLHETQGPEHPGTFVQFLRAKYLCGRTVANVAHHASLACGAHSLFEPVGLERLLRDAATAPIMPPNEDTCLSMLGLLELGLNPNEAPPPLKMAEVSGTP